MEKLNSTSSSTLPRTKSDQLVETIAMAAKMKSPSASIDISDVGIEIGGGSGSGGNLPRKMSSKRLTNASPGRGGKNTHIRKSRSAQMKFDLDDLNSGAALSRASSASLGFSFSFTGFTMPPEETADSRPFSDDDILEDIEAGTRKNKFQTEPTLPIYLKWSDQLGIHIDHTRCG